MTGIEPNNCALQEQGISGVWYLLPEVCLEVLSLLQESLNILVSKICTMPHSSDLDKDQSEYSRA